MLFDYPELIELGQQIDALQGALQPSNKPKGINHRIIERRSPNQKRLLSFAQQRLWFLDQLEPEQSTYNMVSATRLSGELDVDVLIQSLNYLQQRHELLHCQLGFEEVTPYWMVTENPQLPFSCDDIGEDQLQAQINTLATEPFNLASDLLWRAKLLKISSRDHTLIVVFHHIISDGLSIKLFNQEFSKIYTALLKQDVINLPTLPINYSDFSGWQRQWMTTESAQKSLAYWKFHLADSPPLLELPTDYDRPVIQSSQGKKLNLHLSEELVHQLQRLSQRNGITLYMTMLATFKVLLARLSDRSDIILGTPVAGRNLLELEPLFGFFVNTVVLRTELGKNLTFNTLLKEIQATVITAYEHQGIPFEKLVEEVHPQRSQSYHPIFQIWFNFLVNFDSTSLKLPNCITENLSPDDAPAKFDLTLYVRNNNQGIQLRLVYNADLFGDRRAAEMLNQYEFLLQQVVARPDSPINQFSLVTQSTALVLPNPTQPLSLTPQCSIPDFIAGQVAKFAERLAVVDTHQQWTYQALDHQSHLLAQALLQQGLQPQEIVAIYGDRRGDLIWVIWGILKAGGAFLLLDSDYPEQRQLNCLNIAQPVGLIDLQGTVASLTQAYNFLRFSWGISQINFTKNRNQQTLDLPAVNPDNLAYVLFTSGSTGKPKGIKVNHHPLIHFLHWYQREFKVNQQDHFGLLAGLSHDILLRDIFAPLALGAPLYVPKQTERSDSQRLAQWLDQHQITVTHLTPPLAELISVAAPKLSSLRYCFFGGDQLTKNIVATTAQFAPNATLVNFYGTTETPQAIAFDILPPHFPANAANPPLGKGIDDTQLLILNEQKQQVGIGELGEIYVRSPYLALGYFNDHSATEAAFISNPFTGLKTDLIYKTGDLGRYLPDGRVEFVGRRDDQVKIRGFRIELGDIEAQLNQHPGVHQSLVVVKSLAAGEKQLVAYLVMQSGQSPLNSLGWREYLSTRLPNYMIPSYFIDLAKLPLTPNGKIDQAVLPIPSLASASADEIPVAPRTELETKLAQVWQQVLKPSLLSIHDNFFDLGGHSLLAVKLVAEIEKYCGVKLPLSEFFFHPTIAQLSQFFETQNPSVNLSFVPESFVPIKIQPETVPLFAIHTLGLGGKYFQLLSESMTRSVIGINSQLESNLSWSFRTINRFADDYAQDLLAYQPEAPFSLIGYSIGGLCAFEVALRLLSTGRQIDHLILIDTFFPGMQNNADFAQADQINNSQKTQHWLRKRYYQTINELRYLKYIGQPLSAVPESLHHYVSLRENRKAHRHHQIQTPYPGNLIYVRSTYSRPSHAETWQGWVKGEFICHEIPAPHNQLLTPPHAMAIADILKGYF